MKCQLGCVRDPRGYQCPACAKAVRLRKVFNRKKNQTFSPFMKVKSEPGAGWARLALMRQVRT